MQGSSSTDQTTVTRGPRSLWRGLAAVVALGFVMVVLQRPGSPAQAPGSDQEQQDRSVSADSTPLASQSDVPRDDEREEIDEIGYELTAGFDPSVDRIYLLSIPGGRTAFDPQLVRLDDGAEPFERLLGGQLWSGVGALGRLNPGEERHPLILAGDGIAMVTLDGVLFQERTFVEPARNLGPGIAILAGPDSDPDSVWVLGTAERTARLVDVSSVGATGTIHDIDDIGRPVASAGDGLILAPSGPLQPDYLYWRPGGDIEPFIGSGGAAFLGADGGVAVFGTAESMLVFSIEMPERSTSVPLPFNNPWGSAVSPDGTLIALSLITELTEPNVVIIADLSTGETLTEIKSALQYQYRWSGTNTLLYMLPEWPAFRLMERDAFSGTDRNIVRFPSLNWWYAVDTEVRGNE